MRRGLRGRLRGLIFRWRSEREREGLVVRLHARCFGLFYTAFEITERIERCCYLD